MDKIEREIRDLTEKLLHHQHLYYVRSNPEISDREYDALFDRLQFLEETYPQYADDNSPTKRVGVDLDNRFEERDHKIAVLSLDKAYTTDEILKWIRKHIDYAEKSIDFVIEEKLDGASIVLEYQKGVLTEALTRGNGIRGNVVTENVRTIKSVPLRLSEPIDLLVRGEIFIEKNDFERYNHEFDGKYSNPRNLASGSLRQLKSSLVSSVP